VLLEYIILLLPQKMFHDSCCMLRPTAEIELYIVRVIRVGTSKTRDSKNETVMDYFCFLFLFFVSVFFFLEKKRKK
jgi:hypothetical protein